MVGRRPITTALGVLWAMIASAAFVPETRAADSIEVQQHDKGVKVLLNGKLFAEYLIKSGAKPIVWPIIGPTGEAMTRSYPMEDAPGEKHDHIHQRSFWFTYGEVNGVDFWAEEASFPKGLPAGKIVGATVHREFKKVSADNGRAVIETVNDWVDSTGKKHCEDVRTLTFQTRGTSRVIDFDVTVKATDGPVHFGDTKEGALGLRVASVLDVKGGTGHIVTSEGLRDDKAWGKPARWVDYYGTLKGETVGIAFLNHPSSFHAPTRWHVRDYGLFAANPFGMHDFEPKSEAKGGATLEAGKSLTLRHRLIFHRGNETAADVEGEFAKYAAGP